jgi:8-oxo-dGTP diphosphatase
VLYPQAATVHGLIVDPQGRWLLVRPLGEWPFWHVPGGPIARTEPPSGACRRVLHAQLGIDFTPARLHVLAWDSPQERHASLTFVFHMGVYDPAQLSAAIRLHPAVLDEWRFMPPSVALSLLHPCMAEQLHEAGEAVALTVYIEGSQ